jgi:hypothetical protein
MTQELDKRIKELCELITKEKNSQVFLNLVTELNQRLGESDKILHEQRIRLVSKQSEQLLETSSSTYSRPLVR